MTETFAETRDRLRLFYGRRPPRAELAQVQRESSRAVPEAFARAFVTEAAGKTILTAPAGLYERAATPNPHYLWIQGAFVGAERANRNGALWSTGDLELGNITVPHGPLNWLHEARKVIGTITDAAMVAPPETAADDLEQPYIAARSAVWRWLYPDEARCVEMGAEARQLWYSMECVSRQVACVGEGGCGAAFPYMAVVSAAEEVCAHIRAKSATRRFVDPIFLGGAVILPPVRPGWPGAHAELLTQAAAHAEHAFDQAGRPAVSATEWELLMAQVLQFAQG